MKNLYNDFPEKLSEATITALNKEYNKNKVTPLSFFDMVNNKNKEQKMQHIKSLQNEIEDNTTQPNNPPSPSITNDNFRLYSLISSNYCNLINLFNNIISKTSSSKRETYQQINAQLRVDQSIFNDTYNTLCNMEQGAFCNYNQLIYITIDNFIDLIENLSNLSTASINSNNSDTVQRLKSSTFRLFRLFIDAHPIRY